MMVEFASGSNVNDLKMQDALAEVAQNFRNEINEVLK